MVNRKPMSTREQLYQILELVTDPEIPVLTVVDMGIVRDVKIEGPVPEIIITPTYSGCPAMDAISMDIRMKMLEHGIGQVKISTQLSPAWTTEWMSESGKNKLRDYGIAPPSTANKEISCPRCGSKNVVSLSEFGSTACKALYQCQDCKEPFDYFKCH
jgi:ring-1,2-phenylacetyl-CoA epoxidase subunit PaaD